jgi:hypothetical protein
MPILRKLIFTMTAAAALLAAPSAAFASTASPAATAVPHAAQAAMSAAGSHVYTTTASPAVMRSAADPDFTCPDRTVCLFQDPGLTGPVCEFPMPGDGDIWFALRSACGFSIPWGSLNDNTGSRVIFQDRQTGAEYCKPAGYRGTPSSAVRNTGYMYIQYGVPDC